MEKRSYSKPFLAIESFIPQDFIAACTPERVYKGWKAYGSSMIISGTYYHDVNNDYCYWTLLTGNQTNEEISLPSGSVPTNASSADDDNYIAGAVPEYNGNDGDWYTGFNRVGQYRTLFNSSYVFDTPFFVHNGYYIKSVEEVYKTEKNSS